MDERNDSIEKRLEHMERECRRLRLWCASATGLFLVACTAAALAPRENTIRAERFEVIGKDGRVLAVLGEILMPGGTGLQVGNLADDRASAMFGVFPAKDPATGQENTGALLHLESASHVDPNIFTAHVSDSGAAHYLTNDSRSIGSFLEPGRGRLLMTTTASGSEDEEDQERFEVLVEGDQTSVTGSSTAGEVLFRQP